MTVLGLIFIFKWVKLPIFPCSWDSMKQVIYTRSPMAYLFSRYIFEILTLIITDNFSLTVLSEFHLESYMQSDNLIKLNLFTV